MKTQPIPNPNPYPNPNHNPKHNPNPILTLILFFFGTLTLTLTLLLLPSITGVPKCFKLMACGLVLGVNGRDVSDLFLELIHDWA